MNKAHRWVAVALALVAGSAPAPKAMAQAVSAEMVVQATIPRSGFSIAFDFDALWMMSDGRLVKVNASDNSTSEIEIPVSEQGNMLADIDKYRGIATGEGFVWVPDMGSSTVYKVDPHSDRVVGSIATDIFGAQGSIGVGAGSVWILTFADHDRTLTRYSAESGAVQAEIALPNAGKQVLFDRASVWVTAASAAELYRIDSATNSVVATIALHSSSHLLASSEGAIWVAFDAEGLVQRIDAATSGISGTIDTGVTDMESDGDIAAGGGFIWVITRGSIVAQVDPATNSVKAILSPPLGTLMGRRIRYGAGSLWISGSSIFRIAPP